MKIHMNEKLNDDNDLNSTIYVMNKLILLLLNGYIRLSLFVAFYALEWKREYTIHSRFSSAQLRVYQRH